MCEVDLNILFKNLYLLNTWKQYLDIIKWG